MPRGISILVPDVASNILGAATALARHLQPEYSVEIVGPDLGGGVNPMYRGAFDYKVISAPRIYRYPDFWRDVRRIKDAVTGEIVIAVKAYANTVPVALQLKRERGCRAVVYLDEWDGGVFRDKPAVTRCWDRFRHAAHPLDDVHFPRVERMIPSADLVICTTTFLQERFRGQIVPFGVDTKIFAPQDAGKVRALRESHGLAGKKVIVFGGVVRPHKGLELILDALARLGRDDTRLVIVGPRNEHVEALLRSPAGAKYIVALGPQPKQNMPLFLDLADLAVLPLNDSRLARSQMPCKVFEAMAMAKPVIATAISDLPLVLKDCGRVVPPNDAVALAEAIAFVIDHPAEAARMGGAAREKCIREYSAQVTRGRLQDLIGALDGCAAPGASGNQRGHGNE